MHVEKKEVANLRDGLILSSSFFTHGTEHTAVGQQRRLECELGEVITLALALYVVSTQWRLMRRPLGSSAALRDARLSGIDKSGVYVVEAETDGRWTRSLEICAFTRLQMFGRSPVKAETRLQQRSWLNDPTRTVTDVIDRLEK